MSDDNTQQDLSVSNPFQAVTEIFYNPKAVFESLAIKNNWSWIPFIILAVVLFIPPYLYFGIVNFDWYVDSAILPTLQDMTPAEQEAILASQTQPVLQWATSIAVVVMPIILFTVVAFYLSLVTKNDNKSVQGFTDWYGALWWISLPLLIGSLISLIIISLQEPNAQVNASVLAPLSLAYVMGTEMSSPWLNFLMGIRLESFWSIWLTSVCISTWTNFSKVKSIILALIPTIVGWLITLGFVSS